MTIASAPPILDFSGKCEFRPKVVADSNAHIERLAFYGGDQDAKSKLVDDVRKCCLHNGFFQITGHNVPAELQEGVLDCLKDFFALPQVEKEKVLKG